MFENFQIRKFQWFLFHSFSRARNSWTMELHVSFRSSTFLCSFQMWICSITYYLIHYFYYSFTLTSRKSFYIHQSLLQSFETTDGMKHKQHKQMDILQTITSTGGTLQVVRAQTIQTSHSSSREVNPSMGSNLLVWFIWLLIM